MNIHHNVYIYSNSDPSSRDTHLLLVDNIDPCLDVREGVRRCQDGFAFVLLVQVAVSAAVQSEGSAVHEGTQVVVLVKVGDSFLQLICVKVGLDIGDLQVSLKKSSVQLDIFKIYIFFKQQTYTSLYLVGIEFVFVHWVGVFDNFDHLIPKFL